MARVPLIAGAYQARSVHMFHLRHATVSDITEVDQRGGIDMVAAVELSGRRFGRWLVGNLVVRGVRRQYECTCDCGTMRNVKSAYLLNGDSKSCGCLNKEVAVARATRHGMTGTALHNAWKGMLTRCDNPKVKCAKNYSGRHIMVCERWRVFENFRDDMGPTFQVGLTLERIANGQGYMPDNCRWATRAEQSRNRRSVRLVQTPFGEMTIAEAARAAGTSWFAMGARVERKWPIERLLDPPKKRVT